MLAAGLVMIGTAFLRMRSASPQSPGELETSAGEAVAAPAPAHTSPVASAPIAVPALPPAPAPAAAKAAKAALQRVSGNGDAAMLRIKAGEVLATVNGAPIELKDLLPLPAGKETADQAMPADRYAFLLDRAVDREIALQTAQAQGLDLTESQREQLASLRARSERPAPNLFDDLQHNPANADFEARDAAALLLQASLAEKAGVPARDVNPAQVKQYYQAHRAEFATLPEDAAGRQAAWENIDQDIRVKLAQEAQAQHEAGFGRFVDQLRASATIIKVAPPQ